jgi:hypothetical protein
VYDLLETPEDFFNHVKRVTASVAAIVIFGHRAATPDSFWTTVCFQDFLLPGNRITNIQQCVYDAMGMVSPVFLNFKGRTADISTRSTPP